MSGNPFYTPTGAPGTGAEGLSAQMRTEFRLIGSGFDLLPRISTTGQFGTTFIQSGSYKFTLPERDGAVALLDDLATETARAEAAEATQATMLAGLVTSTGSAISAEASRATAAEGAISAALGVETQQRTDAITAETQARVAAIAGLSSGSSATIGGVSAAVTKEVADRTAADGALTIRLSNAEVAISAETNRASGAEGTINASLTAEVARAKAAEIAATTAASNERIRALAAEANLQPALGFVPYNSSNPADYVTGARLSGSLSPYPPTSYVNATFATYSYVQGTFAPISDGNGWPVARLYSSPQFNGLNVTGGTIIASGSRQAAVNGWSYKPDGPNSISAVVSISIETGGSMLAYAYYANSDARLKSERAAITDDEGERFVRNCPSYKYIKGGAYECGFLAQDVGDAGFPETIASWEDDSIPDEAFGYTGPKGKSLILNEKTPSAYLAAGLRSALAKIDALTAELQSLRAQKEAG